MSVFVFGAPKSMGNGTGTHLLFPPTSPSRKPPPMSVFVFGALSAPKPDHTEKTIRKTERALTDCFRPRGSPNATARVSIKFRRPERAQTRRHTEKTIRKTERALTSCFRPRGSPNATARVRIKFRRPERAQTRHTQKKQSGKRKGHSRTVSVHADHPTPPPASESSFGALSAPKPDHTEKTIRKTERALTACFRPRGSPNATARVRIKFRRPERAQTRPHRKNNQENGKGTHRLFPSTRITQRHRPRQNQVSAP